MARLGIKSLDETEGLQVYGQEERVRVTNHKGPWQSVTVLAHRLEEIDTPEFLAFLKEASASFHGAIKRMQTRPEDVMPWKVNGERWHMGEKGFAPGAKVRWDRQVLSRVLNVVREVVPDVEVNWDQRDTIALRVPGVKRAWASCRTKDKDHLDCRFLVRKGKLNLTRLEGLGQAEIADNREDVDVLRLRLTDLDADAAGRLRAVLREQVGGFREVYARA